MADLIGWALTLFACVAIYGVGYYRGVTDERRDKR